MARKELSAAALLLLGLLHERPMHPYQVHQTLKQRGDDRLASITPGSVYHAMDRLESEGLVEAVGTDREGNRPQRTTYRLTDAGREAFAARTALLLGEPRREHPCFPLALSQAHAIDRASALAATRARRAALADELAAYTSRYDVVRHHGLPRRLLLDVEYDIHRIESELTWLDGLLADLDSGALDWDEPVPQSFRDFVAARSRAQTTDHVP
ncbi:PadR family transcriptional regulator [Oerskovia jenensis]|uniref:DNA-binding PadR family transcriptional regulator n=1 Tax=Oerskovia jenensis TaxID=162169 RepID=A0ABS2LJL4_9CELL|nr:PadR family transcriptional regulator [Oerskovia jenensis]MBM7480615.1 DNA-binding PadR family transcriptional regulator [Oerskovia jenensis]